MKDIRFSKTNKIIYKLRWYYIRIVKLISQDKYVYLYRKLLKDYGMNIDPNNWGYIDTTVYFDNYDYSKVSIGQNVTISRDVLVLNHDFSICQGLRAANIQETGYFLNEISIGDNCFIGAKVVLLPGTRIGRDSIIGAGAVVKGEIPENSVVIGNPARIIGKTTEFGHRHYNCKDFIEVR